MKDLNRDRLKEASIDQWAICKRNEDTFLSGFLYGHPYFGDGEFGYTGMLRIMDVGLGYAQTNNTFYSLGVPLGTEIEGAKVVNTSNES